MGISDDELHRIECHERVPVQGAGRDLKRSDSRFRASESAVDTARVPGLQRGHEQRRQL